ncbi:MAG: glucose-phosphate cytidylyltransferase [Pseudonocardiales bacterium]|nr:glucose-phosphate cytidylyltransferase [Pseudonocardiales bacterium]
MIPVAILCGGKGTRMTGGAATVPKPLVEIGGRPILWHVMSIYAAHGTTRFILLCGHGAADVEAFAVTLPTEWDVTCLDTGLDTPTGGRVARARDLLDDGTFAVTYADGVADIDLGALFEFHRSEGAAATMTVVRPENPWGVAEISGSRVQGFHEKPPLDCWVNGGFLVMEPRALDSIGPDDVLEREPMEALAGQGELAAYRHDGFWDCMDTYKDTLLLNELWAQGRAPWRPLVEAASP